MSVQTGIETNPSAVIGSEAEPVDVNAALGAYFGGEVLQWQAHNLDIYSQADQRSSDELCNRIGGMLVIKCDVFGDDGVVAKRVEIDGEHRPLPEDVIAAAGNVAMQQPSMYRLKTTHSC